MPGPGRGPPGAGRGAPGRGGMPGVGPPPGRGGTAPGRAGAGRAGIAPGLGRGGAFGAGADGRAAGGRGGMPGVPSAGVLNGLLPGRGPGGAGRGGWPAGVGAAGEGARSAAGAGRAGPGTGPLGRAGAGAAGAGPAELAGAGAAEVAVGGAGAATRAGGCGAAGGAAAAGGKASRSLRTTGASTVEEADLTNSPCSFSQVRTFLLSIPSSLASSWTRALPGTVLLLGPGLPWPGCYCMGVLIGEDSSGVHSAVDPLSCGRWKGVGGALRCSPATCSRTGATSSGPARRRARGNARRFSARSTQRGSRCTKAPRPGRRPPGSGVRDAVP